MKKNIFKLIFIVILCILTFNINSYAKSDIPTLTSPNFGIYNLNNMELLYGKNENIKIPIASITKLMTAIISVDNIKDLSQKVTIDYSIISKNLDPDLVTAGIYNNETLTYYDLIATMLIPSGADSAIYLANTIFNNNDTFISKMNEKAKELGMTNTSFSNPTGLDDENNYSTINDVSKMLEYALKNDTIKEIISMDTYTTSDKNITVSNTIQKSAKRYGITLNYIKGGKTGTTGDAGICLASYSKDDETDLIAIVTGAPMYSTNPYNIIDSENLYKYISNEYSTQNIISIGDLLVELNTICCKEDNVKFYSKKNITKYIDNIDTEKIKIVYNGLESLDYNVKEGTKIGKVDIYYDEKLLDSLDIEMYKNLEFSLSKWISLNRKSILYTSLLIVILIIAFIIILKNKYKRKNNKSTLNKK